MRGPGDHDSLKRYYRPIRQFKISYPKGFREKLSCTDHMQYTAKIYIFLNIKQKERTAAAAAAAANSADARPDTNSKNISGKTQTTCSARKNTVLPPAQRRGRGKPYTPARPHLRSRPCPPPRFPAPNTKSGHQLTDLCTHCPVQYVRAAPTVILSVRRLIPNTRKLPLLRWLLPDLLLPSLPKLAMGPYRSLLIPSFSWSEASRYDVSASLRE